MVVKVLERIRLIMEFFCLFLGGGEYVRNVYVNCGFF